MLYFIQAGDRLKIGITQNLGVRLATLQTGNPDRCRLLLQLELANDRDIERMLHERLAYCRLQGEWFNVPYATALEHLLALKSNWIIPGAQELPIASPQRPQLKDHSTAFQTWLRDVWYREGGVPEHLHIEELWATLGNAYMNGETPPTKAESSAIFARIAADLTR